MMCPNATAAPKLDAHAANAVARAGELVVVGSTPGVAAVPHGTTVMPDLILREPAPGVVGEITFPFDNLEAMAIIGQTLFVAHDDLIYVYDVENPVSPALLTIKKLDSFAHQLSQAGPTTLYATVNRGIEIFDISDPRSMRYVSTFKTPYVKSNAFYNRDYGGRMQVKGRYGYFADGDSGLAVLDLQDPLAPVLVTEMALGTSAYKIVDVAITGNVAVLLGEVWNGQGLVPTIVTADLTNPVQPVIVGNLVLGGTLATLTARGNYAYVSTGFSGTKIIDVSTPWAPHLIAGVGTNSFTDLSTTMIGQTLFTAGTNWYTPVARINIADPATAAELDRVQLTAGNASALYCAFRVLSSGQFVYALLTGWVPGLGSNFPDSKVVVIYYPKGMTER